VKAIKIMIRRSNVRDNGFLVNDQLILVIFDVPHLGKCFRNHLKDAISIEWPLSEKELQKRPPNGNETRKIGRFSHIVKAWQLDKRFYRMSRLTKAHIYPKGVVKMRVKLAFQLLSQKTASMVRVFGLDKESRFFIPGAAQTGDIISDIDKLLDDVNGSASKQVDKPRRAGVNASTKHPDRWRHWRKQLTGVIFNYWDKEKKMVVSRRPPFFDNFITTLKSLGDLWAILQKKPYHQKHLNLRQLSQDPQENFHGVVRGLCGSNDHPTVPLFEAAMKTALVTDLWLAQARF